jgi:3-phosphoshikimate 1-carboxyvinyltransferase
MSTVPIKTLDRPVNGTVIVPGSKSITNRALLLAALAEGRSVLRGALFSDDTRYMAAALNRLGISVQADEPASVYEVDGTGGHIPANAADLYVGNAGTAARFLTAFLSLGHGRYRLDGVQRMRQRPMGDLLRALNQLGVQVECERSDDCPPVVVNASGLTGGRATLKADMSSQFLTALLLVGPLSEEGVVIEIEGEVASKPYVDITLHMMERWGVAATNEEYKRFTVAGGQKYVQQEWQVEPDASSASYFFAAAAATGGCVRIEGLGSDALQGDLAFVDVLEQMGCTVRKTAGYTEVQGPEKLRGVEVDMNGISDTVMSLAAIAPFADSPTTIHNVGHIRYKETDRLHAIATELRRLGAQVEETEDSLRIEPAEALQPAEIETYDDHRMAMSFAITGLRSPGVVIKDPACVSKTFPDFFRTLRILCEGS